MLPIRNLGSSMRAPAWGRAHQSQPNTIKALRRSLDEVKRRELLNNVAAYVFYLNKDPSHVKHANDLLLHLSGKQNCSLATGVQEIALTDEIEKCFSGILDGGHSLKTRKDEESKHKLELLLASLLDAEGGNSAYWEVHIFSDAPPDLFHPRATPLPDFLKAKIETFKSNVLTHLAQGKKGEDKEEESVALRHQLLDKLIRNDHHGLSKENLPLLKKALFDALASPRASTLYGTPHSLPITAGKPSEGDKNPDNNYAKVLSYLSSPLLDSGTIKEIGEAIAKSLQYRKHASKEDRPSEDMVEQIGLAVYGDNPETANIPAPLRQKLQDAIVTGLETIPPALPVSLKLAKLAFDHSVLAKSENPAILRLQEAFLRWMKNSPTLSESKNELFDTFLIEAREEQDRSVDVPAYRENLGMFRDQLLSWKKAKLVAALEDGHLQRMHSANGYVKDFLSVQFALRPAEVQASLSEIVFALMAVDGVSDPEYRQTLGQHIANGLLSLEHAKEAIDERGADFIGNLVNAAHMSLLPVLEKNRSYLDEHTAKKLIRDYALLIPPTTRELKEVLLKRLQEDIFNILQPPLIEFFKSFATLLQEHDPGLDKNSSDATAMTLHPVRIERRSRSAVQNAMPALCLTARVAQRIGDAIAKYEQRNLSDEGFKSILKGHLHFSLSSLSKHVAEHVFKGELDNDLFKHIEQIVGGKHFA